MASATVAPADSSKAVLAQDKRRAARLYCTNGDAALRRRVWKPLSQMCS